MSYKRKFEKGRPLRTAAELAALATEPGAVIYLSDRAMPFAFVLGMQFRAVLLKLEAKQICYAVRKP